MLLRCRHHGAALLHTRRDLGLTTRLPRLYSSSTDTPPEKETIRASKDENQRIVDPAPVYSETEAEAASASKEGSEDGSESKAPAGPRTRFICDQEPVVVHEMTHSLQSGKWYRIVPEAYEFKQTGTSHMSRVPSLAHGLERVLFNPGVHYLQDPNSGVYNFYPYIRNITQPDEFDYDKLTPYITSSKDSALMGYARKLKKRFVGSTSSMTHVLSHLYFLVSANKGPDLSSLSMAFESMPERFTRGMRYPASIALRYHDGVYGIDADKSFDVKDSILSVLGKSMEKLLTSTPNEFERYKKENSWKVNTISEENYHYSEFDEFVLRSQLDCRDDRLPRRTFDLKTRGTLAVRMDINNYEKNRGYQILSQKGRLESFEREYYDMARSAFLKYNFQVRIGNMDGIFVAYHNTARMFGFQYISRGEMDRVIYGNEPTGNKAFRSVLILLGKILRSVTEKHPMKDLRVTFDGRRVEALEIWVEVIDDNSEEAFLRKYQEPGFLSNVKRIMKEAYSKPTPTQPSAADPLNTRDPFSQPPQEEHTKTPDEAPEDDSAADDYIDPEKEIFINTNEQITHFTLEMFSTVNGQDTDNSVTVKSKSDEWFINWRMTKSHKTQDELALAYRRLRLRQATYFERSAQDTPEKDLPFMLKMLRRISQRNMWRNEKPKGRVVVNRAIQPITASPRPRRSSTPPLKRSGSPMLQNKGGRESVSKKAPTDPAQMGRKSTKVIKTGTAKTRKGTAEADSSKNTDS
ncbi:hypothetical protein H4217_001547 [Coemansia sp. RSA 1939]|nr:hypothetical protein H4217_001547 [Coemansia sp. RSA 1939]